MPEYLTIDHLSLKDIKRIFSKIEVNPITGCWNWTAALNTYGYGQVWYKGKDELVHRIMWAWLVGPLQRGYGRRVLQLDHIVCDSPQCSNPCHLRLATTRENCARTASASASNRRKTHCKRGHLLPSKPNRRDVRGRMCIICRKMTCAAYYQKVGKQRQRERRSR